MTEDPLQAYKNFTNSLLKVSRPTARLWNYLLPNGVMTSFDLFVMGICQNSEFALSFRKIFVTANCAKISSNIMIQELVVHTNVNSPFMGAPAHHGAG